jgi:carboxyl-terminal processing protease
LFDGSALLLAVGEWLTPGGRTFWHKGLKADAEVALPTNTLPLTPALETDLTAARLESSGDEQLLRALALLTNAPGR